MQLSGAFGNDLGRLQVALLAAHLIDELARVVDLFELHETRVEALLLAPVEPETTHVVAFRLQEELALFERLAARQHVGARRLDLARHLVEQLDQAAQVVRARAYVFVDARIALAELLVDFFYYSVAFICVFAFVFFLDVIRYFIGFF